ncbi:hypothetical protein L596_012906 [Steinernema carpocapsae]|uniref:Uncharacterized protein n=1 Tax=Steinernema carpocapsae TaxID=34508 RepID=A0A4U5NZC6_STECR|nr:hypothetical protein L596_012906 [Steinernema carpocapsae]
MSSKRFVLTSTLFALVFVVAEASNSHELVLQIESQNVSISGDFFQFPEVESAREKLKQKKFDWCAFAKIVEGDVKFGWQKGWKKADRRKFLDWMREDRCWNVRPFQLLKSEKTVNATASDAASTTGRMRQNLTVFWIFIWAGAVFGIFGVVQMLYCWYCAGEKREKKGKSEPERSIQD